MFGKIFCRMVDVRTGQWYWLRCDWHRTKFWVDEHDWYPLPPSFTIDDLPRLGLRLYR